MATVQDLSFEEKRQYTNFNAEYWNNIVKDFKKLDIRNNDMVRINATDESINDISTKSIIDLINRIENPPTVDSYIRQLIDN